MRSLIAVALAGFVASACGDGSSTPRGGSHPAPLPAATCAPAAGGGSATTAAPTLRLALDNGSDESWLGSPAVADLDGDGEMEILAARDSDIVVWGADGTRIGSGTVGDGRIWAAPLVGDFIGDGSLEIVAASRDTLTMLDASLRPAPGFPVTWRDEMRSVAAGDVDGDGTLEIVAGTTSDLEANDRVDIFTVFRSDGSQQPGFPPNTTGTSGCDDACYTHAGFDQNVAVGPIDQDAGDDIFLPQDNAYVSIHAGSGLAYDAAPIFDRAKVLGVRFLHDYAEAQQGWAEDESTALQAHFTASPGAIADLDGDGQTELVMVGSVQNVEQSNRTLGVALWVIHRDGTRPPAWEEPFYVPEYLAGLEDLGDTNIVGLTNQVSIAEIDPASPGLEMVFAGYDGMIHAVGTDRQERWTYRYTSDATVLTGGVAIADLSGDGVPEIVFASYSTGEGRSNLFILDAGGNQQHKVALPGRGAMSVPTIADVDGDGPVEIVVSLKDGDADSGAVLVFDVPGSGSSCLPWPTGRANLLRSGFVRRGS